MAVDTETARKPTALAVARIPGRLLSSNHFQVAFLIKHEGKDALMFGLVVLFLLGLWLVVIMLPIWLP